MTHVRKLNVQHQTATKRNELDMKAFDYTRLKKGYKTKVEAIRHFGGGDRPFHTSGEKSEHVLNLKAKTKALNKMKKH